MADNDNSRQSGLAEPAISDVLAAFLADEKERVRPDTFDLHAQAIELLQASLDGYAANSLEPEDHELWERHFNANGDQHREFCEIFGPEHILPNVGEFLGYFMIRKVMADEDLLRASGTVTERLAGWLEAKGFVEAAETEEAIERSAAAAHELPKAERLATLLHELTSSRYSPENSDIEGQFDIERVEPGKVWLTNIDGGRQSVPVSLPKEFGRMLSTHAGWGMRIAFVPSEIVEEAPEIEVREPRKDER